MSLELVREAVRLNQPIGEDLAQTIVENDIIVPDIKPDIVRILLLDGDAYTNSVEVASDKLLIGGTVRYKILYVSDDPEQPLKSINTTSGFQYTMEMPNVRQGMQCRVKSDVIHMEYEILNSRKVNVKAIISLSGRVNSQVEQFVAQGIEGVEGIQILRSSAGVNSYIGDNETICPVKEILVIPAGKPTILEVLRNDVKITGKEYKLSDGKIVAKGELNVSTLYIGDDETRSIQFMEHEIPFSQIVEMPGIDEGSYGNVEFEIGELSFEPSEDADGELRQIKCEAVVKVYSDCFCKKEIELVEDAYGTRSRISLEKEQLKMEELLNENKSQVTLKETVNIDEGSPDISEVFNVLCKLSLSDSEITDDRVVLEGVAGCSILYLAGNEEQPVFCTNREIPFRQVLDVKDARAGMGLDVELEVEHCSYSMVSAKEVEIRLVIGSLARVSRQVTVPVVARASEQALDDSRLAGQPSITIYFTQQGDTLWKVAKKYYTTMEEIGRINDIGVSDTLSAGEQILIPRKI